MREFKKKTPINYFYLLSSHLSYFPPKTHFFNLIFFSKIKIRLSCTETTDCKRMHASSTHEKIIKITHITIT